MPPSLHARYTLFPNFKSRFLTFYYTKIIYIPKHPTKPTQNTIDYRTPQTLNFHDLQKCPYIRFSQADLNNYPPQPRKRTGGQKKWQKSNPLPLLTLHAHTRTFILPYHPPSQPPPRYKNDQPKIFATSHMKLHPDRSPNFSRPDFQIRLFRKPKNFPDPNFKSEN